MGQAIIPVISLLATAAGGVTGAIGAQQSRRAMENATADQVAGQMRLQKQASPVYEASLKSSTTGAKASMDAARAGSLAKYQQLQALPTGLSTPNYQAPGARQQDVRTQAEIARGQQASAALQKYPALQSSWDLGNREATTKLGNISAIGQSLSSIFPALLSQASQAGASTQGIGSLLGTAGSLLGVYGAFNKVPGSAFKSPAPATPGLNGYSDLPISYVG